MVEAILVSICVPAYKRIDFLQRLLDSIFVQTFRNFEVVVTDDSPDDSVRNLCDQYQNKFLLRYYRNAHTLGTPANWNEAIRKSSGEWVKLMHDDDWFADENSLQYFIETIDKNNSLSFVFSAYQNVSLGNGQSKKIFPEPFRYKMLGRNPATLLSANCIGPPSVVLHKKNDLILYDTRLKWLVDIDFYMRYLSATRAVYIPAVLVNIGISGQQVTKDAFGNRQVEVPENFLLLEKTGTGILKNILVFDAWWRLIRNLRIRNKDDIRQSGYEGPIPSRIIAMIQCQHKISMTLLKIGLISKMCMFICFLFANETRNKQNNTGA